MPRRTDISSVLVIGSGPIVIGQAAEFDYSGTQACRVLREEGLRVILVNSNPATIMTDPEFADATYIEPITPDVIASRLAPIISTPNSSRVPFSASAMAAFSAVWPPRVGSRASGRSFSMILATTAGVMGST